MQDYTKPSEKEILKIGDIFRIIGDNTRLKLIFELFEGRKTVGMLSSITNSSQSLVSHQLKILKDNNIVECEKNGNFVYYFLVDEHVSTLINICRIHVNEALI